MIKNVYYDDAKKSILELFDIEFPGFEKEELSRFMNFFYQLSNYEEEGQKIRPSLYLTNNINAIVKNVSDCYKLVIHKDSDGSNFKSRIKSLLCFCKNDWQIYICYSGDYVEYGLLKAVNSIKDKTIKELIFEDSKKVLATKVNLINIDVISGGLIILNGIKGNRTTICFNLNTQVEFAWEENIKEFVDACCTKINTRSAKKLTDLKNIYFNIFYKLFKGVHGTICLVVDKDFSDKKAFFSDGTWLKEPIEIAKLFLQSKSYKEFKLTSYADLITTMLNYDGITVIDNAGRVRAYNVFIESNAKETSKVAGGARRRAAYTLLKHKNTKIVGVYFQSQDGDNFYTDSSYYHRRKRISKSSKSGELLTDINDQIEQE